MLISLNFPNVFVPGATELDNALALRALLDCMIRLNMAYHKEHQVPALYESGVTYGRTEIWEPVAALYLPNKMQDANGMWQPQGAMGGRRIGDCKSLATARVAELRLAGKKANPTFRFAKKRHSFGALLFHILVQTDDGWEDPSAKLGMPKAHLAIFE